MKIVGDEDDNSRKHKLEMVTSHRVLELVCAKFLPMKDDHRRSSNDSLPNDGQDGFQMSIIGWLNACGMTLYGVATTYSYCKILCERMPQSPGFYIHV